MRETVFAVCVLACAVRGLCAAVQVSDPADKQIVESFLKQVETSAAQCTPERMVKYAEQPEDITWQASWFIRMPLLAYRLTGSVKYLDMFTQRMDTLCDCLKKGADGYLGWYGLPLELFRDPQAPHRQVDVILTEFVVSGLMAEFAALVHKDEDLKGRYASHAQRYLRLIEDHLITKWDARGQYKDLGAKGAVFVERPDLKPTKATLTLPHNKHAKIARALLRLYDATRKDDYLAKALKLGTRFKRCLSVADDRYTWNYWDPAGPWDIDPNSPAKWKHWIGPEHRGGYYALSASQAVLLYERGLVFDKRDMSRFVKTQVGACWNGDFENPAWARVDGRRADQRYLCPWLAPFDERIYRLAFGEHGQKERLKAKDHSWQGGPVTCEWLEMKYVTLAGWKDDGPAEKQTAAAFLAEAGNRALAESLTFEVAAPGYQAPQTPAQAGQ